MSLLAVNVPAEFQVVGQNPVGESVAVAGELLSVGAFAPFHLLQVDPDIFGLEVPEGNFLAGEAEVRRTAGDALGLVGGRDTPG